MDVAFICAMPLELAPLVKHLSLKETEIGGVPAHVGSLDAGGQRRDVVAIVTGMGTKLAADGTRRLLDAVAVERVVVVGITGAVENQTPIGTLIVPEAVVDSASGAEYQPAPLGLGPAHGKMWTVDVILTDPDVLAGLRARGVVSLDMETAAIAAICEERGIPWSVVRVISDRASDGSVDEATFRLSNQDGTPNPKAIAKYMARHPDRIPQMARLGMQVKRAATTAAETAVRAYAGL